MCYPKVSLRAFFDYNPLQDPLIPCKEVGIALSTGDILHVVNMEDAKWWQVSWKGPSRSEDRDGNKNFPQKLNSRSINLNRDYPNTNGFVKCRRTFLELYSLEPCPSSWERKFCRPLYTSSIKRENRHFHVVVVQWRQRNVQKNWYTCKVVGLLKSAAFFTLSLPSSSSDLKVPVMPHSKRHIR